jgi:hypothetical protein
VDDNRSAIGTVLSVVATLLLLALLAAARDPVDLLPLPAGASAWTIDIEGGITGAGGGRFAVDSSRQVRCALRECGPAVAEDAHGRIAGTIAALRSTSWSAGRSVCSDCYVIRMTVRRRTASGSDVANVYTWTVADASVIPADVQAIYDAMRVVMPPAASPRR